MEDRLRVGGIYVLNNTKRNVLITMMPEERYGKGKYLFIREKDGVSCYRFNDFSLINLEKKLIINDLTKVNLTEQESRIASRVLNRRGL